MTTTTQARAEEPKIEVDAHVEARTGDQMASRAVEVGVEKGTGATAKLIVLGLLAGVYIGLGGIFAIVVGAGVGGAMPFGMVQLVTGLAFSLGLVLVLVGGAELFTGNVLLLIAWAEGRLSSLDLARAWGIVYAANFAGSLALAGLVLAAGVHTHGDHAVATRAVAVAAQKTSLGFGTALASGILANLLVCLAVWLYFGSRTTTDRILAIILPITAFVALGTEHSVANMFMVPYGILVQAMAAAPLAEQGIAADPTLGWIGFLANLAAATAGNVIGGTIVGLAYWLAYLRK